MRRSSLESDFDAEVDHVFRNEGSNNKRVMDVHEGETARRHRERGFADEGELRDVREKKDTYLRIQGVTR